MNFNFEEIRMKNDLDVCTGHKYMSVNQVADSKEYPFTLGQVRHYLIKRHRNGLAKAIRKIGKRIYIHKALFDQWIESHLRKEECV